LLSFSIWSTSEKVICTDGLFLAALSASRGLSLLPCSGFRLFAAFHVSELFFTAFFQLGFLLAKVGS
jgi:hypothetical protein